MTKAERQLERETARDIKAHDYDLWKVIYCEHNYRKPTKKEINVQREQEYEVEQAIEAEFGM